MIGVLFGGSVIVVFGLSYYFVSGLCGNSIVMSKVSANGKLQAVLFERSCGATTSFSTQISLLGSDKQLINESGNVYIAEGQSNGYILNWESDTLVKIRGAKGSPFKKEVRLHGVQFKYD